MMSQSITAWDTIADELVELYMSFYPDAVTKLIRLIELLKLDQRFVNVTPDLSHSSLVLRKSRNDILVIWYDKESEYKITSSLSSIKLYASDDKIIETLVELL